MKINCQMVLIIILITLGACSLKPTDDKDIDLNPYLKAISNAGELRDSLGFSLMIDTANITIEKGDQFCDVLMRVTQNKTLQTIALKKNDKGFEWVGEEEKFWGPQYMAGSKGNINEAIVLTYCKKPMFHRAPGHLYIEYQTPDSTRDGASSIATVPNVLPENEARAMIKAWAKTY